jgi:hypothetical protein
MDKIFWIHGILKRIVFHWHQAGFPGLASQWLEGDWEAYSQAADAQFKNEHEVS